MRFRYSLEKNANIFANNVDHDQMLSSLMSDLGPGLPITLFGVSRLQWIKPLLFHLFVYRIFNSLGKCFLYLLNRASDQCLHCLPLIRQSLMS